MACSASAALIAIVRNAEEGEETQEDWTVEGINAHKLAAAALDQDKELFEFFGVEGYEFLTPEMCTAVQVYIDYVRAQPGRRVVEYRIHRPELHELFYSTIDCAIYPVVEATVLKITDYKHGAGVTKSAVRNQQLLYYAAGFIMEAPEFYPDWMPVELAVVQPRAFHPEGPIRVWRTTVGDVKAWLLRELLPAMEATKFMHGWFYSMGEHCRFCPAKLGCPAFGNLIEQALVGAEMAGEKNYKPVVTPAQVELLKMVIKASGLDTYNRLLRGEDPEVVGAKLVYGKANRVWSTGGVEALREKYGDDAFETKPKSPFATETDLPDGKAFAAQWGFSPEGKPTVALLGDHRTAIATKASDVHGKHVAKALDYNPEAA